MSLSNRVVLLDGGMGQELLKRSQHAPTPLWSASVMLDEANLVREVHSDYIRSGARVITLNNYTATPTRLADQGIGDAFESLHQAAIAAATASRSAHVAQNTPGHAVRIAGCLPPLVSSYHAEDVPNEATCARDYTRLVQAQEAGVDLFLCETLTTALEVQTATAAGVASGKPVWTSMTVSDTDGTLLRSGEPLEIAVQTAVAAGASAVLINCSWPEAITQGLPILAACGLPFGAYANGFTDAAALEAGGTVEGLRVRTDLGPDAYAVHAMRWVAMGARLVGGCCEVGPAHIQRLSEVLQAEDFVLTDQP